ncbi:MurR/RpiR family transcriptional regulator [Mesorhizobium xinjiangense]|uniref:MurR/RpiR family transcriptional regulator n=1 Tax=Mesorhizobium xinjiangense TaxID=2678685 RepID=UPI001F33E2B9|nr:MurR/RpiR family transcriptional regulator [Mesorhizobium xinjiangense]
MTPMKSALSLPDRIIAAFDSLPEQLGQAARYILDNPNDVALLSMREQARRAGVKPWTMTRLARRLGYAGYEDIREESAAALRRAALGFSGRAGAQAAREEGGGEDGLMTDIAQIVGNGVTRLAEPATMKELAAAAALISGARRVYCLGLRAGYPVAAQFAYLMSFLDDRAILLGRGAGTDLDAMRHAGAEDVLFAISAAPYTGATIETARYAARRGVPVLALTDSPVSPLAAIASRSVIVSTDSPSFVHTMTPALAAVEILASLVVARGGAKALEAIAATEEQLAQLNIHLYAPQRTQP